MQYYLFDQDLLVRRAVTIGSLPDDMDPLEWIRGQVITAPPSPVRLRLSDSSGDTPGDIVQPFVTVYSDKLRQALTNFGVDNVEFFPAELEHPRTGRITPD